jgi:hypothetical protein
MYKRAGMKMMDGFQSTGPSDYSRDIGGYDVLAFP